MKRPSIRSGQLAAFALMSIVILLIWQLVLSPVYSGTARAIDHLAEARFRLQRLTLLAQEASPLSHQDVQKRYQELTPFVFQDTPVETASTHFLGAVEAIIQSTDVRLIQLRATPPRKTNDFTHLAIDATVTASEPAFVTLLTRIERHRPLLTIDGAAIQVAEPGTPTTPPIISAQLHVTALSRSAPPVMGHDDG
jgi:hypothetical protein